MAGKTKNQDGRKIIFTFLIVLVIVVVLYLGAQINPKPHTQNETVNDVITIIEELDKPTK